MICKAVFIKCGILATAQANTMNSLCVRFPPKNNAQCLCLQIVRSWGRCAVVSFIISFIVCTSASPLSCISAASSKKSYLAD